MPGHAQHVQLAIADLEGNSTKTRRSVSAQSTWKKVDREHAGGLGAQELPPTRVGAPDRCRWDAVALQDPPDRRGAHAVAESEQLALESLVPPARVLPRHPHHDGGEHVVDRWTTVQWG